MFLTGKDIQIARLEPCFWSKKNWKMNALQCRKFVITCVVMRYNIARFRRICAMWPGQLQIRKIWRGWLLRKNQAASSNSPRCQMCACPFDFIPFTSARWPFAGGGWGKEWPLQFSFCFSFPRVLLQIQCIRLRLFWRFFCLFRQHPDGLPPFGWCFYLSLIHISEPTRPY